MFMLMLMSHAYVHGSYHRPWSLSLLHSVNINQQIIHLWWHQQWYVIQSSWQCQYLPLVGNINNNTSYILCWHCQFLMAKPMPIEPISFSYSILQSSSFLVISSPPPPLSHFSSSCTTSQLVNIVLPSPKKFLNSFFSLLNVKWVL